MPFMFRLSYLVPFLVAAPLAAKVLGLRYFTPWEFARVLLQSDSGGFFAAYALALTLGIFYALAWPWTKGLNLFLTKFWRHN
ncbi:hypothetical protein [Pseudomonas sp. JUb52]|uniref:hypothetical protein n=1 Tax=Pseudomonas sp. JUb52 TaxID=2485127 RepID=UPI001053CA47|nr:hypothetical protein [Pseudomonas sp. JUb52]TCQ83896.1 hypothetical protein EC839_1146 [Pseudomonas sp. JUb52]